MATTANYISAIHSRQSRTDTMSSQKSSLFTSLKRKLSKKPSKSSDTAVGSANRSRSPSVRQPDPAEQTERNPLVNPSPPTRRPRNDPPPSYTEATAGSPIAAAPAAGTGPATSASSVSVSVSAPSGSRRREASPARSVRSVASSHMSGAAITTPEDPYAFLSSFDTIFVIDDSGSMAGRSWREVKTVLANITPVCTAHDADGIDLYFLNHKSGAPAEPAHGKAAGGYRGVRGEEEVERIFAAVRPTAATPTGTRINAILRPYLRRYEEAVERARAEGEDEEEAAAAAVKPINMIVITDGVPTDDLEGVLVAAARRLDRIDAPPYQVGIQFFQVGSEPGAREALRDLDDNLGALAGREGGSSSSSGGGLRDIVDTVTWDSRDGARPALTADAILKTVLGAVVKRLDRAGIDMSQHQRFLAVPRD